MIPLAYLLIPYGILVAVVMLHGLLITWTMYRFGGSFSQFFATCFFWGGVALILLFTWITLAPVDWRAPLIDFSAFAPPVW